VTRYLLDTNIISNVTKPNPSTALLVWMAEQADNDLFISALTVGEIRRGLLEKSAGKKRFVRSLVHRSGRTRKHFSQAACCLSTTGRPSSGRG
jgi:predicted nucleic acid-binding protein